MRHKTEKISDIMIVRILESAVDAGNALEFKAALLPFIENSRKVAIDMSKVKFMDSSGIGAMLSCLRTTHNQKGGLKLFSVTLHIHQLFKLVRLDTLIEIHDSQKSAINSFKPASDEK
jgi:anti-sigma B factor antagonist